MRVELASFTSVDIAQVNHLHVRILFDNPLHYRLQVRGNEDIVLCQQSPVGI